MKFFVAFVALVAIAVASPLVKPIGSDLEVLEAIVAAIQSPSTDPATAALLEQQLQDLINAINPEPIAVGPAIVKPEYEPISVGPAIIGPAIVTPEYEPISVGPAIIDFPVPVDTSPVVVGPIPEGASPLVQIIVNINQAGSPAFPEIEPTPVHVVDSAEEEIVEPIQVIEVKPEPVQVVDVAPAPVEPVIIETPIIPSPVILPEELN